MEGPLRHNNLDVGAAMIIPVPAPLGGVVVVGEAAVVYLAAGQPPKTLPLQATIVRVRGRGHPAEQRHQGKGMRCLHALSAINASQPCMFACPVCSGQASPPTNHV